MGVESNDVVRMLGSYPDREADTVPQPSSPKHPGSAPSSIKSQPTKRPSTLFAVLPLPLGENDHSTDVFSLTALLTPVKLVIVGMKPSANTWFRTMRESKGGELGPFVGCASWLRPGEVLGSSAFSDPVLAYSWGSDLQFLRVRAVIRQGEDVDSKGKPIDVKTPEFVEGRRYEAPSAIRALQWYNANVSHRFCHANVQHVLLVTSSETILLDVRSMTIVEDTPLQTRLLTSNDFYAGLQTRKFKIDAVPDCLASSVRTHRGKLFLLASVAIDALRHC
jgi:hypothetical protein